MSSTKLEIFFFDESTLGANVCIGSDGRDYQRSFEEESKILNYAFNESDEKKMEEKITQTMKNLKKRIKNEKLKLKRLKSKLKNLSLDKAENGIDENEVSETEDELEDLLILSVSEEEWDTVMKVSTDDEFESVNEDESDEESYKYKI